MTKKDDNASDSGSLAWWMSVTIDTRKRRAGVNLDREVAFLHSECDFA